MGKNLFLASVEISKQFIWNGPGQGESAGREAYRIRTLLYIGKRNFCLAWNLFSVIWTVPIHG